jgi:GTP pyrophosphokinase
MVQVLGVGDLMTSIAQCCHPVPGDKIIGYITRSRGVSIHRQDCHNIINEDERERLIPVEWGQSDDHLYPVNIQVEAWDRVGLMRDIATVVAEEKVNITSVNIAESTGETTTMFLTLETKGLAQLSQILKKIDGVKGVISVNRVGADASRQGTTAPSTPTTARDDTGQKKNQTEVNLGK